MDLDNQKQAHRLSGPGPVIKEQLTERGWTQEDFADIIGMSLKSVNKLLLNKQSITLDTAKLLYEVFGHSPLFWINLDTKYRLWLKKGPNNDEKKSLTKVKSELYKYMPINELFKKKWIDRTIDPTQLEKQVMKFWGQKKLDLTFLENKKTAISYRKSSAHQQFNQFAAETWCQMVKNSVEYFSVKKFDKAKLEKLYNEIYSFTNKENGVEDFLEKLNDAGVIFMFLPHLQKTYIDGATLIIKTAPIIVYTGRFKRYDNFWFTLAHEIAHILLGHLKDNGECIIDDFQDKSSDTKDDQIIDFFKDSLNYITELQIHSCADKFNVHPALIIGALAHKKIISFAHLHVFNKDILPLIPKKYFVESYLLKKV